MSKTFRRNLNIIIKKAPLKIANDLSSPPLTLLLFSLIPKDKRTHCINNIQADLLNGDEVLLPLELYLNYQLLTIIKTELADQLKQLNSVLGLNERELTHYLRDSLSV